MISIHACPVCNAEKLSTFISSKDFTVSHGTFSLTRCSSCEFVLTNPQPEPAILGQYYLSSDYISHTNKATSIIDKIYLAARSYTLNWKIQLLQKHTGLATGKLLDYGCGTGAFLQHCSHKQWNVFGVEPSPEARQHLPPQLLTKVESSLNQLHEQQFDAITLWHVLEHIPNLNEIVIDLEQKLMPNGTLFIAVPNYKCFDASHYREKWAAYDVPRHLWHFSQPAMQKLMTMHGLTIKQIIPMKLDAFYVSLLSEKYQRGASTLPGMISAFFWGLRSNFKAAKTSEYSSLIYVIKK